MGYTNSVRLLFILLFSFYVSLVYTAEVSASSGLQKISESKSVGRKLLWSFKETPRGSNVTFECSPSGPCVPCQYSEKSDEKYHCSETGYRIPMKCEEIEDGSQDANEKKGQNSRSTLEISHSNAKPYVTLHDAGQSTTSIKHRSLLDDSSTSKGGSQAYITYRSCVPFVYKEKLSVFGFEGIMLCLFLISGSVVYFKRKRTVAMSGVAGPGRIQTNSRF